MTLDQLSEEFPSKNFPFQDMHTFEQANTDVQCADSYGFIRPRSLYDDFLTVVIAYARTHFGASLRGVTAIEAGAAPTSFLDSSVFPHSGSIAQFLLLHGSNLGLDYRPFDTATGSAGRGFDISMELYRDSLQRKGVDIDVLRKLAVDRSICSFSDLQSEVASIVSKGGIPFVFAKNTLSVPHLTKNAPYWQLPGLHLSLDFLGELDENFRVGSPEAPLFKDTFRRNLGLSPNAPVRHLFQSAGNDKRDGLLWTGWVNTRS